MTHSAGGRLSALNNGDGTISIFEDGELVGTLRSGEDGDDGDPGEDGTSVSARNNGDGTISVYEDGKLIGTIAGVGQKGDAGKTFLPVVENGQVVYRDPDTNEVVAQYDLPEDGQPITPAIENDNVVFRHPDTNAIVAQYPVPEDGAPGDDGEGVTITDGEDEVTLSNSTGTAVIPKLKAGPQAQFVRTGGNQSIPANAATIVELTQENVDTDDSYTLEANGTVTINSDSARGTIDATVLWGGSLASRQLIWVEIHRGGALLEKTPEAQAHAWSDGTNTSHLNTELSNTLQAGDNIRLMAYHNAAITPLFILPSVPVDDQVNAVTNLIVGSLQGPKGEGTNVINDSITAANRAWSSFKVNDLLQAIASISHARNQDTHLGQGGAEEVSAAELRALLDTTPATTVTPEQFGYTGTDIVADTQAWQDMLADVASRQVQHNVGLNVFLVPEIVLQSRRYIVGALSIPTSLRAIHMRATGLAMVSAPAAQLKLLNLFETNSTLGQLITQLRVTGVVFEGYYSAFPTHSNNAAQTVYNFTDCWFFNMVRAVDTVSYAQSRSTLLLFNNCKFRDCDEYMVRSFADKTNFSDCWFFHNADDFAFYLDTQATFSACMWVPLGTSPTKAWIDFRATDQYRSINVEANCRVSGETGSCPMVVCNADASGFADSAYPNIAINIAESICYSANPYLGIKAAIILNEYPNHISIKSSSLGPGFAAGAIQRSATLTAEAPIDFTIDIDSASLKRLVSGSNVPADDYLSQFVNNPYPRSYRGMSYDGRLNVGPTATSGQHKATFKAFLTNSNPTISLTDVPVTFMLVLGSAGDINNNDSAYWGTATYIVDIVGQLIAGQKQQVITYTKLHGASFGLNGNNNADIISLHFGDADTGSATNQGTVNDFLEITVVWASQGNTGHARLIPLGGRLLKTD